MRAIRHIAILLGLTLIVHHGAAQTTRSPGAPALPEARITEIRETLKIETDSEERYALYAELLNTYRRANRMDDVFRIRDEVIEDRHILPGRRSLMASEQAYQLALARDYPRSRSALDKARDLATRAGDREVDSLPKHPAFSHLSAEAEIARLALGRHDVALTRMRELSELAHATLRNRELGENRRRGALNELLDSLRLHVLVLVQNNRAREALNYLDDLRHTLEEHHQFKPNARQLAHLEWSYATVLPSLNDYEGAYEAIERALAHVRAVSGADSPTAAARLQRTRLNLALALGRITTLADAAEDLARAHAVNRALASIPRDEIESLRLAARGDWAGAQTRMDELLARELGSLGRGSPFYKHHAALRLLYQLQAPQSQTSVATIERFVDLVSSGEDWLENTYRGYYVENGALSAAMEHLAGLPDAGARALAFRIAELLRMGSSQGALVDGAARLAAQTPALRTLIEQEQLLRFEQDRSRRATQATNPHADDARTLAQATQGLREVRQRIAAEFPLYRELISPAIPEPAQVAAVLQPDEVYVNLITGRQGSYAFAVQPDGTLSVSRLTPGRSELHQLVAAVRKPFDDSRVPSHPADSAGFDLVAAHRLHQLLLAPLQGPLAQARTVYLSSGDVLSNVPWNVLLTRPARDLGQVHWWISEVTPVQMPSASALVMARRQPVTPGNIPLLAFADPSFDGREPPTATAELRRVRALPLRNLVVSSGMPGAAAATGMPGAVRYQDISRLPETRDEAQAIAAAVGADGKGLFLGAQAARSRVLQEDLSRARILVFATHGLLPGEIPGVRTAGLAMAYEGRGLPDSLLTIDDIIGLRLNADWVVLSACNTGYASGRAGDTMSALARGFFAAGGRTLLSTQWAVESESAKRLTVALFKSYATDTSVSKAQALARAQRDMLAGKEGDLYRHPYFWAPYFLAGDAARPLPR